MDQTAYFEQMRQKRRAEILDTARVLILERGAASFSMQQLARSLDISTVTLYKYFKNSQDVMLALHQYILQSGLFAAGTFPDRTNDLENLLQNIRLCYDEFLEHRTDICLLILLEMHLRGDSADAPAALTSWLESFSTKQIPLLRKAKKEGLISPRLSDEDTLRFLNTLNQAFMEHVALMSGGEYTAKKTEIRKQLDELIFMIRMYLVHGEEDV